MTIDPCISVAEDLEIVWTKDLIYTLAWQYQDVAKVNITENPPCLNSRLTMYPLASELPSAVTVANDTVTREVHISIYGANETELPYQMYPIEVYETDIYTGFIAKTLIGLEVVPCISVLRNSEKIISNLTYTIGDTPLLLAAVEVKVDNCTNSYFKLVPDLVQLGPAFNVTNATDSRQFELRVEATSP